MVSCCRLLPPLFVFTQTAALPIVLSFCPTTPLSGYQLLHVFSSSRGFAARADAQLSSYGSGLQVEVAVWVPDSKSVARLLVVSQSSCMPTQVASEFCTGGVQVAGLPLLPLQYSVSTHISSTRSLVGCNVQCAVCSGSRRTWTLRGRRTRNYIRKRVGQMGRKILICPSCFCTASEWRFCSR